MGPNASAPVPDVELMTLSDSVDNADGSCVLYLPVAGTVKVTMQSGRVNSAMPLTAGWHPMAVKRVWLTGTDASLKVYAGRH